MVLNEEQWIKELREKRIPYGISQGRLAVASGVTREYLNKICLLYTSKARHSLRRTEAAGCHRQGTGDAAKSAPL